jgi:hypothetical protein
MRTRGKILAGLAVGLAILTAPVAPALAATWIPGHYAPNGAYIRGHWVGGHPDVWINGHYAPNGVWIVGHWAGGFGPLPGRYEGPPGPIPYGSHWVPGFYGAAGVWHPGHWAPN